MKFLPELYAAVELSVIGWGEHAFRDPLDCDVYEWIAMSLGHFTNQEQFDLVQ